MQVEASRPGSGCTAAPARARLLAQLAQRGLGRPLAVLDVAVHHLPRARAAPAGRAAQQQALESRRPCRGARARPPARLRSASWRPPANARAAPRPARCDFSGWNCAPSTLPRPTRVGNTLAVVGDGEHRRPPAARRMIAVHVVEELGGSPGNSRRDARRAPARRRWAPPAPSPRAAPAGRCGTAAPSPSSRPRPARVRRLLARAKKSCSPRQMPSTGRPLRATSRTASPRPLAARFSRRAREVPDARHHDARRPPHDVRVGRERRRVPAGRRGRARRSPGCSRRSPRRRSQHALGRRHALAPAGSIDGRPSSARANALTAASTMWCGLSPRIRSRCAVSCGVRHQRAEELRRQEHVVVAQHLPLGDLDLVRQVRPARHVHHRAHQRLVQRHAARRRSGGCRAGRPAPARWPAPARCRCPPPCDGRPRAGRPAPRTARSNSPCRAKASSMWSKNPMPVLHRRPPRPVEVDADEELASPSWSALISPRIPSPRTPRVACDTVDRSPLHRSPLSRLTSPESPAAPAPPPPCPRPSPPRSAGTAPAPAPLDTSRTRMSYSCSSRRNTSPGAAESKRTRKKFAGARVHRACPAAALSRGNARSRVATMRRHQVLAHVHVLQRHLGRRQRERGSRCTAASPSRSRAPPARCASPTPEAEPRHAQRLGQRAQHDHPVVRRQAPSALGPPKSW